MSTAPALPRRMSRTADFVFRLKDFEDDALHVTGFTGSEAISELFDFRVELCTEQPIASLDEQIGKPCELIIHGDHGVRRVNGIVAEIERSGEGNRFTHYEVRIVPVHWLLKRRFGSRIFQPHNCPDMSVPGIVRQVLKDAGIPEENVRFAIEQEYPQREFVVQYRQTEFDFISMLMEDEGLFWYFEHDAERHVMVIGDSPVAHTPTPDRPEVPYRPADGLGDDAECIQSMRQRAGTPFGAVAVDDFNFRWPGLDLESRLESERFAALEHSDYPGNYLDRDEGRRYARLRLEEKQCRKMTAFFRTTTRSLLPGYTFGLLDHPEAQLNREYLNVRTTHRGFQHQGGEEEVGDDGTFRYESEVLAIPADTPFRPTRTTPRPIVRGSQTAIVVGPDEEEIHTDEFGRVKVQFHWDRAGGFDENSSCYIRVSQGHAGGGYGMLFLPRIGEEVIVDFLEGNPDRPIITGRVYNKDHMPPYRLPAEKHTSCIRTHSTPGGGGCNEIRLRDEKDNEQLALFAQHELHVRSGADRVVTIGAVDHLTTGKDRHEQIGGCLGQAIGGDHSVKVGNQLSLEIAADMVIETGGDHIESTGGFHGIGAGTVRIHAGQGLYLTCGSSIIAIMPGAIYIQGDMVHINDGAPDAPGPVASLRRPGKPRQADRTKCGQDVRYDGGGHRIVPLKVDELDDQDTFVEFQLLDAGDPPRPVTNERARVRLPDGTVHESVTDGQGVVRFDGLEPGHAEVQFPDREDNEWQFVRIESPGEGSAAPGDESQSDGAAA